VSAEVARVPLQLRLLNQTTYPTDESMVACSACSTSTHSGVTSISVVDLSPNTKGWSSSDAIASNAGGNRDAPAPRGAPSLNNPLVSDTFGGKVVLFSFSPRLIFPSLHPGLDSMSTPTSANHESPSTLSGVTNPRFLACRIDGYLEDGTQCALSQFGQRSQDT